MPQSKKLGDGFAYDSNVANAEQHFLTELGRTFIHNGKHTALAAGATLVHLLEVGAKPAHLKTYNVTTTATPVDIEFTENPTVSVLGTLGSVINKNRESILQSASVVYEGSTLSSPGLHLEGDILVGAKQDGGSQTGIEDEWILTPGNTYAFRIVNNSNGAVDINFHLEWYDEFE